MKLTLFFDGTNYWLADGFHRLSAAITAGLPTIGAKVVNGTKRDAILYSVGANSSHGLRRTNADKRKAVLMMLQDDEWSMWSNREIARRCCVGKTLVETMRKELSGLKGQIEPESSRKVSRNGTTYVQNTSNIGKSAGKSTEQTPTVVTISLLGHPPE